MTFISAMVADNFVAMVADRRLTFRDSSGHVVRQEDLDTKMAILGNHLVGYAGVAFLHEGGGRVEEWLFDTVRGLKPSRHAWAIRSRLNSQWATDERLRGQPHAFIGVGFVLDAKLNRLRPHAFAVSNAMDANWTFNPYRVRPRFEIHSQVGPAGWRRLFTIGFSPDPFDLEKALVGVDCVQMLHGGFEDRLFGTLVRLQRNTAQLSDGEVGRTAVVAAIPIKAFPVEHCALELGSPAVDLVRTEAFARTYVHPAEADAGPVRIFAPAVLGRLVSTIAVSAVVGGDAWPIGPLERLIVPD